MAPITMAIGGEANATVRELTHTEMDPSMKECSAEIRDATEALINMQMVQSIQGNGVITVEKALGLLKLRN